MEDQDKENNCYGEVVISVNKESPEDMSPLMDSSAASILSISSSSNSRKQSRLSSCQASAVWLHQASQGDLQKAIQGNIQRGNKSLGRGRQHREREENAGAPQ